MQQVDVFTGEKKKKKLLHTSSIYREREGGGERGERGGVSGDWETYSIFPWTQFEERVLTFSAQTQVKAEVKPYRCQLIKLPKQFIQEFDQFLRRALRGQAGEAHDVCKQDAVRTEEEEKKNKPQVREEFIWSWQPGLDSVCFFAIFSPVNKLWTTETAGSAATFLTQNSRRKGD